MKKNCIKWIAGLMVVVSQTVTAAPITDTVIVGSQEWAQVDLFTNVSWNTINTQCPGGVCSLASTINGYDLDGWTWASVEAVQGLFNTYTGQATSGPASYSQRGSAWAPAFLADFRATSSDLQDEEVVGLSATRRLSVVDESAYAPKLLDVYADRLPDYTSTFNWAEVSESGPRGGWFVRDVPPAMVPVPATLTLFGLGLASMLVTRRLRGAKV